MLEEKLDLLTKETVALRKAVEANTAAMGATGKPAGKTAPAEEEEAPKAKPAGRGRPKKAEAEPEHSADEVDAIIRQVSKEVGKPVAKKIISSFKCEDLADLLAHPEHFDAAYAAAEAALEPDEEAEEDEEDDI